MKLRPRSWLSVLGESPLLLIVCLALVTLVPGTATLPLLDRDEPRFARATVEMLRNRDFVVPYFNGDYRFDKPILTYWLMMIGYRLFGLNEFGARWHSIISACAVAGVIFGLGRKMFDGRTARVAALVWLTSLQVLIHGRSAVADMPMVACVTLALWAFYELLHGDSSRDSRWFLVGWLALGFGFLAKGPVAWLVPALALGLHRWLHGGPLPWRRLRLAEGIWIPLAIVAIWGVPALIQTGGAFWQQGMNRHVIERGFEAFNNRRFIPLVYYPVTVCISLFPWIAFAGFTACRLQPRVQPAHSFLLAWFLVPFAVFGFYATQLPHYIMPGFPAAALLMGETLTTGDFRGRGSNGLYRIVLAIAGVAAALLIGLAFRWPLPVLAPMRWAGLGLGLVVTGLIGLAVLLRHRRASFTIIALGALVFGFVLIGHGLRSVHPAIRVASSVRSLGAVPWAACGFTEPSLVFYGDARERWLMLNTAADLQQAIRSSTPPAAIVVLEYEARLDRLVRAGPRADPVSVARDHLTELRPILERAGYRRESAVEGFNTGRGTWVSLGIWCGDGIPTRIRNEGRPDPPRRLSTRDLRSGLEVVEALGSRPDLAPYESAHPPARGGEPVPRGTVWEAAPVRG